MSDRGIREVWSCHRGSQDKMWLGEKKEDIPNNVCIKGEDFTGSGDLDMIRVLRET